MVASTLAIWAGDLTNCYVVSKMKIKTNGKYLWARIIGSTLLGQGVDSLFFYTIAFAGTMPPGQVVQTVLSCWLAKTAYETVFYPLTAFIIRKLKIAEGVDHFDIGVNYTPFSLKVDI